MVYRTRRKDHGKSYLEGRSFKERYAQPASYYSETPLKSLCDFDLWPIYALGLSFGIAAGPPDQYLTLTLRQLGFDTFNSNLLSIPAQIGTTVNVSNEFNVVLVLKKTFADTINVDVDTHVSQ